MTDAELFNKFDNGKYYTQGSEVDLSGIKWNKHAKFEGVEMKDVILGSQTGGAFSYHLIKIEPGKSIGLHTHATQVETHEVISGKGVGTIGGAKYEYVPGALALLPVGVEHSVDAGRDGLQLLAKFIPALK
ncbi:MAG: cupin domain-containing protein [Candidatus Methanoplasma sp.]|jgi:quercetin dioxygenase-like cupin family protein|nr:cupin domain-containing protein [Candidatus Methanoplasma sp.]